MIIAQIVLILPGIISVGIETLENIAKEDELLSILNVTLTINKNYSMG